MKDGEMARDIKITKTASAKAISAAWLENIKDLACCSQRGLGERFDGSIGSSTVLFPYGGKYQNTPEAGMAAKIPVVSPRETSTVSTMTFGFDPRISQWSPWHGAQVAVLSSLAKLTCLGTDPTTARLSFQEFFGRAVDSKTWGYPAAALLGSIDAQIAMGTASIGGKDSMSGTFEKINVFLAKSFGNPYRNMDARVTSAHLNVAKCTLCDAALFCKLFLAYA